jgi:hypothetical protein
MPILLSLASSGCAGSVPEPEQNKLLPLPNTQEVSVRMIGLSC